MKRGAGVRLAVIALSANCCWPQAIRAQTAEDEAAGLALDEIVVTARKQRESLGDVPVAIAAISGDSLEKMGVTKFADAVQLVPTVRIVQPLTGTSAYIRGTGSGVFNPGFEQTVGFFIDGAYLARGVWARNGQLDVERVEVLKGPQGVLFGKNTVAGAINVTSRNPGNAFELRAKAAYEMVATDETYLEGLVSGPLNQSGTLKARLAVSYLDQAKGYVRNLSPLGRDGPKVEQTIARATVTWAPSARFDLNLKGTVMDARTEGTNSEVISCRPGEENTLRVI